MGLSPLAVLSTVLASPIPGTGEGAGDSDASTPEVLGGETVRGFADAIAGRIDNDLLAGAVRWLLGSGLSIVLIVVLASVAVFVLKRVIRRVIERAKDPSTTSRARGLRHRVGRIGGDATPAPEFSLRRAQRADALGALLSSIVSAVVWFIAGMMILAEFGIDLAPIIAGAGVLGLAIGFGAQDLVKDLLSGIFMLAEDQFGVGDIVDAGEAAGVVEGVTLRTTKIRDVEGTLWHVPNGEIRRIGNSSQQWARSLLDIGISYGTDVDVAIDLIGRVANAMAEEDEYRELFLDEPEVWGVQALGPDSVDIRLVIKTVPAKQWAISRELRRRIKTAFDSADVEIPFPQRTVWLRTEQPLTIGDAEAAPYAEKRPTKRALERAVKASRQGDRGKEVVEAQDHAAVAEDVEEQQADEAGAEPAGDDPR
ncbi:mechanosensitive ion channel family protein [Nitriliruptoraceae bacterium ZYF776]|nr:mechanosensitive ion channel family protein [Profundirhabdus halotolerans]